MSTQIRYSLFLFFALASTIFFSCNSNSNKPSKNIIDSEKMSSIIADLKIIDAAYQTGTAPKGADESQKTVEIDTLNRYKIESNEIKSITSKIKGSVQAKAVSDSLESSDSSGAKAYKPKTKSRRIYIGNNAADYQFVFDKYNVSRKDFEESIDFYSRNPEVLKEILEKSLEILTHNEIRMEKE